MQKKIQSYDVSENVALIITFSVFIITGAALLIWLVPLLYIQLQAFILDVPNLINNFLDFISGLPAKFPDLVSSEQISIFFQAVSEEITAIAQNIVKSSISGIQSAITFLLYIILFPILVYFFLFDRKNIIDGFIKIIPGKREMFTNIWAEMDIQLSNYVRGKTIEIFIVGIAAAIIFASLGLKYSALLSVLVGLSVIIPYVGAFLVTIPIVSSWLASVWIRNRILYINRLIFIITGLRWEFTCAYNFFRNSKITSSSNNTGSIYIWKYVWFLGCVLFNTNCNFYKSSLECMAFIAK